MAREYVGLHLIDRPLVESDAQVIGAVYSAVVQVLALEIVESETKYLNLTGDVLLHDWMLVPVAPMPLSCSIEASPNDKLNVLVAPRGRLVLRTVVVLKLLHCIDE